MQVQGNISKMNVSVNEKNEVKYQLNFSGTNVVMNELIGKTIQMTFANQINCVHCNRVTKKSFGQGYCFPCLQRLAQCDTCIIKPELCHFHLGTCREPEWGESNCFKNHIVYLSNTGAVKVGITRFAESTVSSRWIDQGATQAIAILRVQNRLVSGLVEKAIGEHIGDKTNWRTMLKGNSEAKDLVAEKQRVLSLAKSKLDEIVAQHGLQAIDYIDTPAVEINYPVTQYPVKIKSINLDKEQIFSGTLLGVKGQYLLLDGDRVINMRKYSGYDLSLEY